MFVIAVKFLSEDTGFTGIDASSLGEWFPVFWRNVLPSYFSFKSWSTWPLEMNAVHPFPVSGATPHWCDVTSQKTGICTYTAVKTSKLVASFSSNCSGLKSKQPMYSTDKLSKPALFQVEGSPANTPLILVVFFIISTYTLHVGWLEMLRGVLLVT